MFYKGWKSSWPEVLCPQIFCWVLSSFWIRNDVRSLWCKVFRTGKSIRLTRWLYLFLCGKESAYQCMRSKRCWFDPWVGKIPWRRGWHPTPVFLPGKSHGLYYNGSERGSLFILESFCPLWYGIDVKWGRKVRHDWATGHTNAHINNFMSKNVSQLSGQIPIKGIQISNTNLRRMISQESYYY